MAARLNPRQDERCRAAIQTTQLCKRLNSFALGWNDPQTRRPLEMTDTQVRAALGLLRKTLPDLAVTTFDATDAAADHWALHLLAAKAIAQELRAERENPIAIEGTVREVADETTPVADATTIDLSKPALE